MSERNGSRLGGRILLALLTIYALAMLVPDFARLAWPLGSFGLATNADGLVYDVQAPFAAEHDSPAWRAGLRIGDRLDLARMRCVPVNTEVCATNLALWGGVTYVMPGREATLLVRSPAGGPDREVRLTAAPRPRTLALDVVLLLSQTAGVLVVLGAAYLAWIRPGPMTWGFFAYVLYFNPGQWFQFNAWLQQWPRPMLAQAAASCFLQAAGYIGLLLFALRAPVDRAQGPWRRIERALPALAILFLAVALASLGSAFGYRTEFAMQVSILLGFAVSLAALAILVGRRKELSPRDYQRLRWVIWGCLIGLPAYLIAEVSMETSLPTTLFGEGVVTEDVSGLFYLVNGILCLFVVEAVRRPTVVSVYIPLRRATLLGLLLSVPAYLVHEELGTINEWTNLPDWAWVLAASALVFVISRTHEWLTEFADRLFDRNFRRAEERLTKVGRTIREADALGEIERLLVEEPVHALKLASAALFREEGGLFRRRTSAGWDPADADVLRPDEPPLEGRLDTGPFRLGAGSAVWPAGARLPDDIARPAFAVPVGNPRRCFAVVFYSVHEAGNDLDEAERALLGRFARDADVSYAEIERAIYRARIGVLESQLASAAMAKG
jgi:hypothetical protein